jgi:hypothetical protein
MPSAEVITKWVGGALAGVILALQGINIKEVGDVTREQTSEMALITRVHEELETAIQHQMEIIELLKKQK